MNYFTILKLLLNYVSELEFRITVITYHVDYIVQEFLCSVLRTY